MVNIDTVYQRVLALANKEQRGYITPQEFNLLANQAQMEIFEQYFYDESIQDNYLKNSTEMSNIDENLDEKISIFKRQIGLTISSSGTTTLSNSTYRLGSVFQSDSMLEIEQVTHEELMYLFQSPLTQPTVDFPVFVRTADKTIRIYPMTNMGSNITANVIVKPRKAVWGYVVVMGKALYDLGTSVDFQLHESDETELVYKILSLAGIVIAKPGLGTYGDQQIATQKTQEKQQ